MPFVFSFKKQKTKIRPHALLNGIGNSDTKLKEFNSAQTGFIVQNKKTMYSERSSESIVGLNHSFNDSNTVGIWYCILGTLTGDS